MELNGRQRQTLFIIMSVFLLGWTVRACRLASINEALPETETPQPRPSAVIRIHSSSNDHYGI